MWLDKLWKEAMKCIQCGNEMKVFAVDDEQGYYAADCMYMDCAWWVVHENGETEYGIAKGNHKLHDGWLLAGEKEAA